jgi:serine/threonine protein kinase
MIGRTLSHYKILEKVGSGGMGDVYKAKDVRLDRIVAVKILPERFAESAERRERFHREARVISQLNHPRICTLYEVGSDDGVDYLVMEYIEGETLAERLKKGALPLDRALEYGIRIAEGLDRAHRSGIVHRDLKPGNVMLTKSGVKLLDFGLAKPVRGGAGAMESEVRTELRDISEEQSILGTLQYMAPEQLEQKPVDARTDIFALGAVLYEMITGKKAFEGGSQASLLAAIMTSDPPSLSETQPLSPWILDRTIRKCLKKHPDERWQSAHDLMDELKWIAEGGADASFRIVSRRTRRWPALVAGAGLVAAALIALLPARETRAPMVQASILPPEGMSFTSSFCTYCGRTNALIGLIVLPILTVVGLITYPLFLRARRYYYGY